VSELYLTTTGPAIWPMPPEEMTVSTLLQIEACPRSWALSAADYPGLWLGHGYPDRPFLNSLGGTVVHLALRVVTQALIRGGCSSVRDENAANMMRSIGGYSKVVRAAVDRIIERVKENPRSDRISEGLSSSLIAQIPNFRTQVQMLLARLQLTGMKKHADPCKALGRRVPLTEGTFSEIGFRVPRLHWKGKADLLILTADRCEIVDYKTGVEEDDHRFQLTVYAALWNRDTELNPTARLANRLTLAYGARDVSVAAPLPMELDALEAELVSRRTSAIEAIARRPPTARPSSSTCPRCNVRHLCDAYWEAARGGLARRVPGEGQFADIEVTIRERHGMSSWDARVESSSISDAGNQCLLRESLPKLNYPVGSRLRILNAFFPPVMEDVSQGSVFVIGRASEVFRVVTPDVSACRPT
jgi:hypothetical protein